MKPFKDVNEYIASAPKEWQERLQQLRKAIRSAAPKAEERIGYNMPFYHYSGRLVYFSLAKKHIGLYALQKPVLQQFKTELKGYVTEKGTVQLPLDEKLPVTLVKKLVKAQAKWNNEKEKKKSKK